MGRTPHLSHRIWPLLQLALSARFELISFAANAASLARQELFLLILRKEILLRNLLNNRHRLLEILSALKIDFLS
jgi:hypothetical protein